MNYILVVDDEADIRDVFEVILKRNFPLDVVTAESGNKAFKIISERGRPAIIISDLHMPDGDGGFLYHKMKEHKWDIPFVICSTDAGRGLKVNFPDICGFIEKPNVVHPAVKLVGSIISSSKSPPEYVPVRISLLLRWGTTNFDLFMKLSDAKFVKVVNAGDAFIPSDADRFLHKGTQHLYITADDADLYLKSFETNITMLADTAVKTSELQITSLESLETVERIAKAIGWKPEVIEAAKHAVNLAIKAVTNEPNLYRLLKKKMKNPESKFSSHVTILSLISCGFCHNLGWTSESTQMKLGLAALIHDLTVEESYYSDINLWNQAAATGMDKSPEIVKYRSHPADAANLVHEMKNVPADVDQIILQHHETKEGTGFPRGLISSRITPMACIFIISEDLINFIDEADDMAQRVQLFLKLRESRYNSGNFKKVFEAFRDSVRT